MRGSFFTTDEGAPYLAQFWPDVEGTNARATVPIVPEDFQGEICEFPHLAKTGPDMGHPLILFIRTEAVVICLEEGQFAPGQCGGSRRWSPHCRRLRAIRRAGDLHVWFLLSAMSAS
jgi:hypothetical protein